MTDSIYMPTVISARKHEKIVKGHKRYEKGLEFETRVADYFSAKGFTIKSRKRVKIGEIDLVLTKSGGFWGENRIAMVECKHKELIPLGDFVSFVEKFRRFDASRGKTSAVFAYRGKLDPRINTYHQTMEEKWRNAITLKKL